jgi:hypothetical protein
MEHTVAAYIGVAVFAFLSIATVAGIVGEYHKRKLALEPLRAAIERGHTIDPALIERLMAPERPDKTLDALGIRVGGIITIASGIGVGILSYFVAPGGPLSRFPLLGLGIVALCVGAGLVIAAAVIDRAQARGQRGG